MKDKISFAYTSKLSLALKELQANIGELPKVFISHGEEETQEINDKIYPETVGFDINLFLGIFDRIKLKKDTILDYAFHYCGIGGQPLVYTRKVNAPKISANEYIKRYGQIRKPYLDDMVIENDPESLFQLVLFSKVVHQFYLFWHAAYNDEIFIFDAESIDRILKDIPINEEDGINNEDREKARGLSLEPQVECNGAGGKVRCVLFSKWAGFYYESAAITWPKIEIITQRTNIIPYSCGICF